MARQLGHFLLCALVCGLILPSISAAQTPRPQARPTAPALEVPQETGEDPAPLIIEEWLLKRPSPRPSILEQSAGPATPTPNRAPGEQILGSETKLPLPRYVTLKSDEVNARRGPSLTHRVDWVFTREDLPVVIVAEYGHWRHVVDREGQGGWVHYALLSGNRSVIVDVPEMPVLAQPWPNAPVRAKFALGVIAELGECRPEWCYIRAGGHTGWAPKAALWGVDPDEIRD